VAKIQSVTKNILKDTFKREKREFTENHQSAVFICFPTLAHRRGSKYGVYLPLDLDRYVQNVIRTANIRTTAFILPKQRETYPGLFKNFCIFHIRDIYKVSIFSP